jgi:hypothetical protein
MVMLALPAAAQVPFETLDLPFKGEDLQGGERWVTDVHGGDPGNLQLQGKDIAVVRHHGRTEWRRFRDQATGRTVNSNHYTHGKPFYAMAAGIVVACWRNAPENTPPNEHPEALEGRIHGNGNFVIIEHDSGNRALYAHARTGSVPTTLCPHNDVYVPPRRDANGDLVRDPNGRPIPDASVTEVENGVRVAAGQLLGQVGNSGASSDPHLHVHVQTGREAVFMRFRRGLTAPATAANGMKETASINGPWTRLAGAALPLRRVLLWPPRTAGNVTWNGIAASAFQRTFDHFTDSGMMPKTITCPSNGQIFDTRWVPTRVRFRAHTGLSVVEYAQRHAEYQRQGYRQTSFAQCGGRIAAIWWR